MGMVLIAFSQLLTRVLGNVPLSSQTVAWALTTLSSLTLAGVTFALLFKFLPPLPLRWSDVLLAAFLSAVAWVVASEVLALYGVFFGKNRSAPGAIGGLLAIMLWMSIVSKTLFFGAEMCKVVATRTTLVQSLARPSHS
jgi:membrane protein